MYSFPFYKQLNRMDCGPACLRMVARHYGKSYDAASIVQSAGLNKEGVSLLGLGEAAESIGLHATAVQLTCRELTEEALLPCILHWDQAHFVVLYGVSTHGKKKLRIADPSRGKLALTEEDFKVHWAAARQGADDTGIALLLEPTPAFYANTTATVAKRRPVFFLKYLKQNTWQLVQVGIALLITSMLQLVFPFLAKSLVDTGISGKDLSYITAILVAQLMLVFSRSFVDFIRTRLLLHISNVVNISILSDFWYKLTRLPVSYFGKHHTGDIIQRITDHKQIKEFLTGTAINALFSGVTFIVFAAVLASYNLTFFLIFLAGTILYYVWISLFLRVRRSINYQSFHLSAKESNATIQMVYGMQEIKLHNAEQSKRWEWEDLQTKVFGLNFKDLSYTQLQQSGAVLINQAKDVVITFMVAKMVVNGSLSLGTMLAIQYIIGQLSGPVEQFVAFIQNGQDAKISMERLNEIHSMQDEENEEIHYAPLQVNDGISLENLSFTYAGAGNLPVLKNLSLTIPKGKVTAVVGLSGSGKTTLIKLLLKFFDDYEGRIKIGEHDLKMIRPSDWRNQCSAVLQDGYIFNDTIAHNIAVGIDNPDPGSLAEACRMANILSFITSLPNRFDTKLGPDGTDISEGQKQRLLIARAVYRKPAFLFFDEATNALDAKNEKVIVENLAGFFEGRTVVVVAHRLSTVKNADKIIVLDEGSIIEEGTHQSLTALKGKYYELVKNQLELGS